MLQNDTYKQKKVVIDYISSDTIPSQTQIVAEIHEAKPEDLAQAIETKPQLLKSLPKPIQFKLSLRRHHWQIKLLERLKKMQLFQKDQ